MQKRNLPNTSESGIAHLMVIVAVLGVILFLVIASSAPFRTRLLGQLFPKQFSFAANLPTPATLKVEQDDRNVILNWDNYYTSGNSRPGGVSGYVINWGVYDQTFNSITNPQKKLTEDKIIQLQPLTEGIKYAATVQSVDNEGNVSAPSSLITFQSDSTRVNTLRSQMTGFWDDFNVNAGAFDELRWNNAYSWCAGPADMSGQFINSQHHAHNQIFDTNCDRGQNVSRPRGIFDFSSGVSRPNGDSEYGTITFDMDGSVGRDTWYLDIVDVANGLLDIPARASAADSPSEPPQAPFNNIRIRSSSYIPSIFYVNNKGQMFSMPTTPGVSINTCCDQTMMTVKNVRNHWEIKVSKNRIIIKINGHLAGDVSSWVDASGTTQPLNLPFTKSYLLWVGFSYNTAKADMSSSLLHWDNFGFDGPTGTVQTTETHNYTNGKISTQYQKDSSCLAPVCTNNSVDGTDTIKIPDSVEGATAQRLMFTNMPHGYAWSSTDSVTFNGVKYPIPDPKTQPQFKNFDPGFEFASGITPWQIVIPVNNAKTGDNTAVFHLSNGRLMNIHLELDFPKGSAPTYTQPIDIWKYNPTPPLTGAGQTQIPNNTAISSIIGVNLAGTPAEFGTCDWTCYGPFVLQTKGDGTEPGANAPGQWWVRVPSGTGTPNTPIPQYGTVGVHFGSSGWAALAGLGSYPGHSSYQIYIDRQKVADVSTSATVPSPSLDTTYQWDTTKYCNGFHTVFPVTYTPSGLPSIPSYFQFDKIKPGYYWPLVIYTNNQGQTPCADTHVYAGDTFVVDQNNRAYKPAKFSGGTVDYLNPYSMSIPDPEFGGPYSYRYRGNLNHTLQNIPNGNHNVTLKFMETQWPPSAVGTNVFNVSINGTQVLTNFDVMTQPNVYRIPVDKTFPVTVTNGTINVTTTAVKGLASINAITVTPEGTTDSPLVFTPNNGTTPPPVPTFTPTPTTPPSTPNPTPVPTAVPTQIPTPAPTPIPSVQPNDTIAPTVSINSPLNGSAVTRNANFTINASATDNVQVTRVEFYIDGALKASDTSSPYSLATKIAGKQGAPHTIMVKAYDVANNSSTSSITVTTK